MNPTRPVLRYHGGKWKLADWLVTFFPPHRIYVEAFGGAGSVLLQKNRCHGEIYNDLDSEVVNVFRVLRDEATAAELFRRIMLTPFAREEFRAAYEPPADDVDAAHKMIVRAFMGFGSASMTRMHITGFRSNANRQGTNPSQDWASWPEQIRLFTERLRGVVIENRDAEKVMRQHDGEATLHYVDPPYPESTRSSLKNRNGNRGHYYRHDMTDEDHRKLASVLRDLKGMVVLSGYPCELYDKELYSDWIRHETAHMADGARPRTEVVWLNRACHAALERSRSQMRLAV
jgi:DNA adenine methylase